MKYVKIIFTLLLISLVSFNSCKKDDDDSEPSNHFKVNDKTYKLDKGYIESYGQNSNGSYDWDVYIVSEAIQYSSQNDVFLGVGDVLYLDFNTSSSNGMVKGTYNYSSERNAFTFVFGVIGIDMNMGDLTGDGKEIVGGSVEVSMDGSETLLEFDLTTANNESVTGRFKGVLTLM